jgi:prepilin-type N-terminal cleavage/methylation domain-containing protein/prepilin-type processing-associated H-X9-DG protein
MMRKGFTLIELLVVIAIIAILAAILFPVFVRAREMAQTTKCGAHGKQIATAMLMYLDDNNGRFPSQASDADMAKLDGMTWRYSWPGDPRPGHDIWCAGIDSRGGTVYANGNGQFRYLLLNRYIRNQEVWICSNPNSLYSLKFAKGYQESWCFLTRQFMYGDAKTYPDTAFQTEGARCGDQSEGIGRTIPEIQGLDSGKWHRYMPSTRKIFAFCYALGPDVSWSTETYAGSGKCEPPLYPHNDGTIYVYLDGHAKWAETGCGWAPVRYTDQHIDRPHPKG